MSTAAPTRSEIWSEDDNAAAAQRFYQGMAIACLAAVFAGFARTYFLKSFTGWPPASGVVHWHAALFTGWFVLFFVQTTLIARGPFFRAPMSQSRAAPSPRRCAINTSESTSITMSCPRFAPNALHGRPGRASARQRHAERRTSA